MTDQNAVITRFAPSPTGHLHIGGARTALFCWALAKRAGLEGRAGSFLLRIEDTDRARSSEDAARGILEDLAWLGIVWDEGPVATTESGVTVGGDPRNIGPFHQSERGDTYAEHFDNLIARGLAYPAFETPDELNQMRKQAEAEKKSFIYRQRADYDQEAALDRMKTETHVLRLKVPQEPIVVKDSVLGDVTFPYEEVDDFVIRKADGFPTYHFAVVVDDALMGVTHVLRGQEHLNNSPKHVALQGLLGFETPVYAHMPLIFNPDGTKMSKRDKDKAAKKACKDAGIGSASQIEGLSGVSEDEFAAWLKDKQRQLSRDQLVGVASGLSLSLPEIDVEDFRAAGYLPGVICNFLSLLGWNPGMKNEDGTDLERFDLDFLAKHFDPSRVGKSNAKFDRDKLAAFNADTIQHHLDDGTFAALWLEWAERFDPTLAAWAKEDPARWVIAAKASKPRSKTLRDSSSAIAFAFIEDGAIEYDAKPVKKFLLKGEPDGIAVLRDFAPVLSALDTWTPEAIDQAIGSYVEEKEIGMGKIAQPLRIAMTGSGVSPSLGETLGLVSKGSCLSRIERCVSFDHVGAVL